MRYLLILIPVLICVPVLLMGAYLLGTATPSPALAAEINNTSGIHGVVTYSGVPSGSVPLKLWFDGKSSSFSVTTVTAADGSYSFQNLPTLGISESYQVGYMNNAWDERFLFSWDTNPITQYISGQSINLGSFDIQNMPQLTPLDGAVASLPVDFTWIPRNNPSYKYQVHIGEYYSPILGYTNTFRLSQLPSELDYDTNYFWDMLIFSPDGGVGNNIDWYQVTFTSTQWLYLPLLNR